MTDGLVKQITWVLGDAPPEHGWYLVCLSCVEVVYGNVLLRQKLVSYAWFNPQSPHKWYEGSPGRANPMVREVRAWAEPPEPPPQDVWMVDNLSTCVIGF